MPSTRGPAAIRAAIAVLTLSTVLALRPAAAVADPPTITFETMAGWLTLLHEPVTRASDPYISDWAGQWVSGLGGQQWELWIGATDAEGYAQCHTWYDVDGNQWDQKFNPPFQNWYDGVWNCSGDPATNYWDLFYLPTQSMSRLADGAHTITAFATDAYSSVGEASFQIFVDNTLPSPTSMSGPMGWLRGSAVVTSNATTSGPSGIRGQSCSVGGAPAQWYGGTSARIPVSGNGDIEVDCTAQNGAYVNGPSTGFQVLLDNTPPSGYFVPRDPNDPAQATVAVADSESGVAGGQVQIEEADGWHDVPTSYNPSTGQLAATIPDDGSIADGNHPLRALAWDGVGNQVTITNDVNGNAASITLPARIITDLHVGHIAALRTRCTLKRVRVASRRRRIAHQHPRARLVRHCATVAVPRSRGLTLGYGQAGSVQGLVETTDGNPIAGATIDVSQTEPGWGGMPAGSVITDAQGRFAYRIAPGPSRTLSFLYPGSATVRPAAAQLPVGVHGAVTLKIAPKQVRVNQWFTFSGRVLGGQIPAGGVEVLPQVRAGSETFGLFGHAIYTGRKGRWHLRVRLPVAGIPYTFRFVVPQQNDGWPFLRATTRPITVAARP